VKRGVKMWALIHPSKLIPMRIRTTRRAARRDAIHMDRIIPVTVTYDDGRKAKKK